MVEIDPVFSLVCQLLELLMLLVTHLGLKETRRYIYLYLNCYSLNYFGLGLRETHGFSCIWIETDPLFHYSRITHVFGLK